MTTPAYWMNETTGVLRPAVMAYLNDEPMKRDEIAAMRAYLRQWMQGDWRGPDILEMRKRIDGVIDQDTLRSWLNDAMALGIDPL